MSKHIRVVKKTKSVQKKKKLVDVDWNQVGEKYDPMNFENKENLQKKLDEFYQNLQSNDWETRKHNILQFHKILNGNTITDFSETLIETLGKFKSIFCNLLKEELKGIVKHTCFLISHFARKLEEDFAPIVEDEIFFVLLEILLSTNPVISECADSAIKQVVNKTISIEITSILQEIISKEEDGPLKEFCAEYNRVIIKNYSKEDLSPKVQEIEDSIIILVSSNSEKISVLGRRCFWEFSKHFPQRSKEIFLKLKQNLRSTILAQKHPENNPRNKFFTLIEPLQKSSTQKKKPDPKRSRSLVNKQSVLRLQNKTKLGAFNTKPLNAPTTTLRPSSPKKTVKIQKKVSTKNLLTKTNLGKLTEKKKENPKQKSKILKPTIQKSLKSDSSSGKTVNTKPEKDMKVLITQLNSRDWPTKSNALHQLLEISKQDDRPELTNKKIFKNVITAISRMFADSNSKLKVLSLQVLKELIDNYTLNFDQYLVSILVILIPLNTTKETEKEKITENMDMIRSCFSNSVLIPALTKAYEKIPSNYKPNVVQEMILSLRSNSDNCFEEQNTTKDVILMIKSLLKTKSTKAKPKCKKLLQIILEKNEPDLMKQIKSQNNQTQKLFLPLIEEIKLEKSKLKTKSNSQVKLKQKLKSKSKSISKSKPKLKSKPKSVEIIENINDNENENENDNENDNENENENINENEKEKEKEKENEFREIDLKVQKIILALSNPDQHKESLDQIIQYSESNTEEVWSRSFTTILFHLMNSFLASKSDQNFQQEILTVITKLAKNQLTYFQLCTGDLLREFFRACKGLDEENFAENNRIILSMFPAFEPSQIAFVIKPYLSSNDNHVLLSSITFFGKLSTLISKEQLEEKLNDVYSTLKDYLDHSSPLVRKAVVFTFIDIYKVLGDNFIRNRLAKTLKMGQLKLIVQYIQQEQSKK